MPNWRASVTSLVSACAAPAIIRAHKAPAAKCRYGFVFILFSFGSMDRCLCSGVVSLLVALFWRSARPLQDVLDITCKKLLRIAYIGPTQLLGGVAVSTPHGLQHRTMFPHANLTAPWQDDDAADEYLRFLVNVVQRLREDRVGRGFDAAATEAIVNFGIGLEVAILDGDLDRSRELVKQILPRRRVGILAGQPRAQAFQHFAHIVNVEYLLRLKPRHHGAAIRYPLDQATLFQRCENITYACT